MRLNNFRKALENTPHEMREQVKKDLDTMDNINLQSEFDDLKIDLSLKESELDDLNKSYAELKKRASILTSQVKIRDTELIVLQKRIALLDEVIRFISREKAKVKGARNFAWIVAAALLVFELLKK